MENYGHISGLLEEYPKEVILKDGSGITLRPVQKRDEALISKMLNRLSEDDRWFLSHDVTDTSPDENRVKEEDPERVISIVAVLEGEIVANATLIAGYYGAKRHIGKIKISVVPHFRERYLGTWMLLDLINLGMAMGLEILVMRLVKGRDSSLMRSVEKLGFSQEAVLKDYVKDMDGNSLDLIIVVKRINRGWE